MRGIVLAAALALAIWPPAARGEAAPPVSPEIMLQAGHDCHVRSAAWSPDSRFIATVADETCGREDLQVIVWEAATGRVFDRFVMDEAEQLRTAELVISPDGRFLLVAQPWEATVLDLESHARRRAPMTLRGWRGDGGLAIMDKGKACDRAGCEPLSIVDLATGKALPLQPGVQNAPSRRITAELTGLPGRLIGHIRLSATGQDLQALPLPAWADGVALAEAPASLSYWEMDEGGGWGAPPDRDSRPDRARLYYFDSRSGRWGAQPEVDLPTPGLDAFRAIATPSNMGALYDGPTVLSPSGKLFAASFMRELADGPRKGVFAVHPIDKPASTALLTGMPRVSAENVALSPGYERLAMVTVERFEAPGERQATDFADDGVDPRRHSAPKGLKNEIGQDCAIYFDCEMRSLEVLNFNSGKLQTVKLGLDYTYLRWLSDTIVAVDPPRMQSDSEASGGTAIFDVQSGESTLLPLTAYLSLGGSLYLARTSPQQNTPADEPFQLYDAAAGKVIRTYPLPKWVAQAPFAGNLEGLELSPDRLSFAANYRASGPGGVLRRVAWTIDPAPGGDTGPRDRPAAETWRSAAGQGKDDGLDRQYIPGPVGLPGQEARAGPIVPALLDSGAVKVSAALADELFTLYLFRDGRYMLAAPSGRYDTNLPADTEMVGWVMRDQPRHLFAPQTFMRDYFEPGLARRTIACGTAHNCEAAFKPLRPVAELNRVLPSTRIVSVRTDPARATAVVEVEATEGVDAGAPNGKTRSGLHDLRLFRDGKLVAQFPEPPPAPPGKAQEADWRRQTALSPGVHRFTVALPSDAGGVFSAYAFNEDRVKGETATQDYTAQPKSSRTPRAYVIAIGENRYDNRAWTLNFAAADARLTAQRLARLPGLEAHALVLVSDGQQAQAAKTQVRDAIGLLDRRTTPAARQAARARLAAAGVAAADLAGFEAATPDDTVILTFSGHGWAEPRGDFYLLASDAQADATSGNPRLETLISAAELSDWLRTVDAGEMAIVIDACHSAASVEGEGFKAGPFGDAGLGQLAFDKGIRILAASQAADVALEDVRLGHGLLTHVLANEGLDAAGYGRADLDKDGRITLDEWLRFASARLPQFSQEVRLGGASGSAGRGFGQLSTVETAPKGQEPGLFDFTGKTSAVALRVQAGQRAP